MYGTRNCYFVILIEEPLGTWVSLNFNNNTDDVNFLTNNREHLDLERMPAVL